MPTIVSKQELLEKIDFFVNEIKSWKTFIYPTDTIYGIWCSATNLESINKIKKIKNRENKLFSVIVPSFDWIKDNCIINDSQLLRIKKLLPWAYTIILLKKGAGTLGVRIPKHYFSDIIEKVWIPFITTSVNLSWKESVIKFENIPKSIYNKVDYIINDDILVSWRWSTIIDMTWKKETIIRK